MKALLALEDGTVFRGTSFGSTGTVLGEVCFNTSMTGYQEILTDPSYKGQIVALTYPEIGNYGVNPDDIESHAPHVSGFVTRELSPVASNWRQTETLDAYLKKHNIPGITHIDTRALTKRLRTTGALKGVLTTQDLSDAAAVQMAKEWHGLIGVDYVKEVTCSEAFEWDPSGELSKPWLDQYEKSNGVKNDVSASKYHVVAIDYGMKRNILRLLKRQGFSVKVMPATATAEQILKEKPDGVFLSNGPGDPAALDYAHAAVRGIMNRVPIFGICLGHQILGHAFGGTTFKLKFGHRGGNQPVKDLRTNKVTMTSQNHGFAVDPKSLPDDVELTHINLNDQTCEGMQHRKLPIFCVQYHPEASPGPHDATYFFKQFREMIEQNKKS